MSVKVLFDGAVGVHYRFIDVRGADELDGEQGWDDEHEDEEEVEADAELAFGELDAEEVASFTEVRNHRSRAVMERLGFRYSKDVTANDELFALYLLARDADRSPAAGDGV